MSLQKAINIDIAISVQGDKADINLHQYTTLNPIALNDVAVGTFVWPGTVDPEGTAIYGGTGSPMGFVERNLSYLSYKNFDLTSEGTLFVGEGSALTVCVRGDYYAVAKTVATPGQAVFANTTDGTISTAAAGGTVAGSVETDWVVIKGGAVGDIIVISNWGQPPATA